MAYKAILGEDLRTTMFENEFVEHFWSISRTVGWGCTNYYDDVMLVQYLVNVWAKEKALKMDGIFGNKTYKGIKSFQKWANAHYAGDGLKTDGRVSAPFGDEFTESGGFYTIHALNFLLLEQRRIYYNDIRMDRLLPLPLCSALSAI